MKYFYITFRSVTPAQRGEQILNNAGIRAKLLRTPKWMEAQGCGYSLRIWADQVHTAVTILRERGVQFRRVYVQMQEGNLEEMEL